MDLANAVRLPNLKRATDERRRLQSLHQAKSPLHVLERAREGYTRDAAENIRMEYVMAL